RYPAAAAVARFMRRLAPEHPEVLRLLSHASAWLRPTGVSDARAAEIHAALGDARAVVGDDEAAAAEYRTALTFDRDASRAHAGLCRLRMPGEDHVRWLERFHELLRPSTYLEIGATDGRTLGIARRPTVAIAVDPSIDLRFQLACETHVYP